MKVVLEDYGVGSELITERNEVNELSRYYYSWFSVIVTDEDVSRYRSLLFWLYSNPDTLFPRLDSRVDDMIEVCVPSFIGDYTSRLKLRSDRRENFPKGFKSLLIWPNPLLTLKPQKQQVNNLCLTILLDYRYNSSAQSIFETLSVNDLM